jgi:hypothetical protein
LRRRLTIRTGERYPLALAWAAFALAAHAATVSDCGVSMPDNSSSTAASTVS